MFFFNFGGFLCFWGALLILGFLVYFVVCYFGADFGFGFSSLCGVGIISEIVVFDSRFR